MKNLLATIVFLVGMIAIWYVLAGGLGTLLLIGFTAPSWVLVLILIAVLARKRRAKR